MVSQLAILATIYSASTMLSAMKVCFLQNQDIIFDPKVKRHPEVLFLSDALPAQFEFVCTCNFTSPSPSYLRLYSTVPVKSLSTCFTSRVRHVTFKGTACLFRLENNCWVDVICLDDLLSTYQVFLRTML